MAYCACRMATKPARASRPLLAIARSETRGCLSLWLARPSQTNALRATPKRNRSAGENRMTQQKTRGLEDLIGTEQMHEGEVESFADGMRQVRQVLAAASTLADYYGHPNNRFCHDNGKVELPDLSAVIGQVLGDQVEVLAFLQHKGAKLAIPPSVVIPPATAKFGRARKVGAQKGKGQ